MMTTERETVLMNVVERLGSQLLILDELMEHLAAAQLQSVIDHLNGRIGTLRA